MLTDRPRPRGVMAVQVPGAASTVGEFLQERLIGYRMLTALGSMARVDGADTAWSTLI